MWLTVLKAALALAIVPLLLTLYIERGKKAGATLAQWTYKNLWFWLTLVFVGAGVTVEAVSYRGDHPSPTPDQPLAVMTLRDYERELDTASAKSQTPDWPQNREKLLRKFEQALYAAEKQDFPRVIQQLNELRAGKDNIGTILAVRSYVVYNNLACALFKQNRNKGFQTSNMLVEALAIVPVGDPAATVIQDNLKKLDEMTNKLD